MVPVLLVNHTKSNIVYGTLSLTQKSKCVSFRKKWKPKDNPVELGLIPGKVQLTFFMRYMKIIYHI